MAGDKLPCLDLALLSPSSSLSYSHSSQLLVARRSSPSISSSAASATQALATASPESRIWSSTWPSPPAPGVRVLGGVSERWRVIASDGSAGGGGGREWGSGDAHHTGSPVITINKMAVYAAPSL